MGQLLNLYFKEIVWQILHQLNTEVQRTTLVIQQQEQKHRQPLMMQQPQLLQQLRQEQQPEPTIEEQVIALENQHHMYRWEREGILTADSPFSDYTKQIAQQIEELAEQLRDE